MQYRVGIGNLERIVFRVIGISRLDKHFLDVSVIDDHRVAPTAHAKTQISLIHQHPHLARKFAVAVGQQEDLVSLLGAAPLARRARAVITQVEDLVDLVRAGNTPLGGELRLGVIPTIAPFLLPRILPTIRRAHPGLGLYLGEAESAALVDGLERGKYDPLLLAFPYDCGAAKTEIFADDSFWVIFPGGHRFADKEWLTAAELGGEDILLLGEGHCLRDHIRAACALETASGDSEFAATSLHTLVQMAANGIGLTLLPKMAIDAGLLRGTGLQARPLTGAARGIGIAWRATSPRTEEYLLLGGYLRDELATPAIARSG